MRNYSLRIRVKLHKWYGIHSLVSGKLMCWLHLLWPSPRSSNRLNGEGGSDGLSLKEMAHRWKVGLVWTAHVTCKSKDEVSLHIRL
jgi:hypothetical protein